MMKTTKTSLPMVTPSVVDDDEFPKVIASLRFVLSRKSVIWKGAFCCYVAVQKDVERQFWLMFLQLALLLLMLPIMLTIGMLLWWRSSQKLMLAWLFRLMRLLIIM
jgi:hypothetical protein